MRADLGGHAQGAGLRAAVPRAGRTRVLAIDGRSGAGKSSLAAAMSGELGAPVVSLEDLYGGWDGLENGIDLLVSEVLEPLAAGRAALSRVTTGCGRPGSGLRGSTRRSC